MAYGDHLYPNWLPTGIEVVPIYEQSSVWPVAVAALGAATIAVVSAAVLVTMRPPNALHVPSFTS